MKAALIAGVLLTTTLGIHAPTALADPTNVSADWVVQHVYQLNNSTGQAWCMNKWLSAAPFPGYPNMVGLYGSIGASMGVEVWEGTPAPGQNGNWYAYGEVCSLLHCLNSMDPMCALAPTPLLGTSIGVGVYPGMARLVTPYVSASGQPGLVIWHGLPQDGAMGEFYLYDLSNVP